MKCIVPAFSYIATANVVEIVGASCVFVVDVDERSFNIDRIKLKRRSRAGQKRSSRFHGVVAVCADMERILAIARKHKLYVIEECCLVPWVQRKVENTPAASGISDFLFASPQGHYIGGGRIAARPQSGNMTIKARALRNHGIAPAHNQWIL